MRPCLLRGLKETLAESSFRHGASRMLQGLTFTSEEWRVGNLGPALFAVIALSVAVILLCCLSQYFDKPEIRTKLRVLAFLLFIVPLLYFTTVTYAKTESEVAKNRVSALVALSFRSRHMFYLFLINRNLTRAFCLGLGYRFY